MSSHGFRICKSSSAHPLVDRPSENGQNLATLTITQLERLNQTIHRGAHPGCCLDSLSSVYFSQLAPGVTIECRDEHWLVSNVTRTTDGFRIRARYHRNFLYGTR